MARFEENAAGEKVNVSGPDFGCIVIAPEPEPKTKAKAAASDPKAVAEGD